MYYNYNFSNLSLMTSFLTYKYINVKIILMPLILIDKYYMEIINSSYFNYYNNVLLLLLLSNPNTSITKQSG